MTLSWPRVAFTISLLSPQTSCSPVLSHQTWLRNCLRLLSLPHSLFFLDIQGLGIYVFSFSTALPSHLRGFGFIPWPPLPHSPALPWHQQPSLISHTPSYCASMAQISAIPPSPKRRSTFLVSALQIPVIWPLPVCPTWCLSSSLAFTQAFAWPGMLSWISASLMHCSCFLR